MSVLKLHCSTVAVSPCENLPPTLSVPGQCGLWETSRGAREGDVLPYVSCHVNRCLREQRVRCGEKSTFFCVWILTDMKALWGHSDVQSHLRPPDSQCLRQFQQSCWPRSCTGRRRPPAPLECAGSRGLHPALRMEQSPPQAHLGTHMTRAQPCLTECFLSHFYVHTFFDLYLLLNQWTRGGGTPVAWHSRVALPPTDANTVCWVTVILGTSGQKWIFFLKSFKILAYLREYWCIWQSKKKSVVILSQKHSIDSY